MTYREFSDIFLPTLAELYRNNEPNFNLHSLVDIKLWQSILPGHPNDEDQVDWNSISMKSLALDDAAQTLLIVYCLPANRPAREARYIAMRVDTRAHTLLYYKLCKPKHEDDLWDIFQYWFEKRKDMFESKLYGKVSISTFSNAISKMPFKEPHEHSFLKTLSGTIKSIRDSIKDIALGGYDEGLETIPVA